MDPMKLFSSIFLHFLPILLLSAMRDVRATTFTFVNHCDASVWPGALSNAGSAPLDTTGFELLPGAARPVRAPAGWSGRFWGRTACVFDASGRGVCATGDCGSGGVACSGAGAAPPATLAEFTLAASPGAGQDFYDVSLVDGYNLPVLVEPAGVGNCAPAGCAADLNARCPKELRVGAGETAACRSACEAFGTPEYCCSGAYGNPNTCKPTAYSQLFKAACPRSYSYAFDDPTSTFTCGGGADYTVTFCPASSPSLKSTTGTASAATAAAATTGAGISGSTSAGGATPAMPMPAASSSSSSSSGEGQGEGRYYNGEMQGGGGGEGVMLQGDTWLASLATGDVGHATARRMVSRSAPVLCAVLMLVMYL